MNRAEQKHDRAPAVRVPFEWQNDFWQKVLNKAEFHTRAYCHSEKLHSPPDVNDWNRNCTAFVVLPPCVVHYRAWKLQSKHKLRKSLNSDQQHVSSWQHLSLCLTFKIFKVIRWAVLFSQSHTSHLSHFFACVIKIAVWWRTEWIISPFQKIFK